MYLELKKFIIKLYNYIKIIFIKIDFYFLDINNVIWN